MVGINRRTLDFGFQCSAIIPYANSLSAKAGPMRKANGNYISEGRVNKSVGLAGRFDFRFGSFASILLRPQHVCLEGNLGRAQFGFAIDEVPKRRAAALPGDGAKAIEPRTVDPKPLQGSK